MHLGELHAGEVEEGAQLQAVLVAGAVLLGLEAEGLAQHGLRSELEESEHRVAVADVDGEEHADFSIGSASKRVNKGT